MLSLEFLTHAALRIYTEQFSLVVDPWLLNEPVYNFTTWKFPDPVVDPANTVSQADAVFITHSHEDHFHVPSLNLFPRSTPIYLPEYTTHPGLRAQTVERTLRLMGFGTIRKLKPWETAQIADDFLITCIPSAETRQHDWENSGLVIESGDTRILNMNDNVSDISLCNEINERWSDFDLGMIQSVGVTMYPGCFVMTEEEMRAEAQRKKISLDEQRRMVELVSPRTVVPFAGDFCWLDPIYEHNNWASRGTPQMFIDFMEREYPNSEVEYALMLPSDVWNKRDGHIKQHPGVDWEDYLSQIKKLQKKYSEKILRIRQWVNESSTDDVLARTSHRLGVIGDNICRDNINFSACFRYVIEDSDTCFVLSANPDTGFHYAINDYESLVDQTLYIRREIWSAILDGKLTMNIIQWCSKSEQHVPYRIDIGRFHFWLEYHIDLETKNCQVYLDSRILPDHTDPVDLDRGIFRV